MNKLKAGMYCLFNLLVWLVFQDNWLREDSEQYHWTPESTAANCHPHSKLIIIITINDYFYCTHYKTTHKLQFSTVELKLLKSAISDGNKCWKCSNKLPLIELSYRRWRCWAVHVHGKQCPAWFFRFRTALLSVLTALSHTPHLQRRSWPNNQVLLMFTVYGQYWIFPPKFVHMVPALQSNTFRAFQILFLQKFKDLDPQTIVL